MPGERERQLTPNEKFGIDMKEKLTQALGGPSRVSVEEQEKMRRDFTEYHEYLHGPDGRITSPNPRDVEDITKEQGWGRIQLAREHHAAQGDHNHLLPRQR